MEHGMDERLFAHVQEPEMELCVAVSSLLILPCLCGKDAQPDNASAFVRAINFSDSSSSYTTQAQKRLDANQKKKKKFMRIKHTQENHPHFVMAGPGGFHPTENGSAPHTLPTS